MKLRPGIIVCKLFKICGWPIAISRKNKKVKLNCYSVTLDTRRTSRSFTCTELMNFTENFIYLKTWLNSYCLCSNVIYCEYEIQFVKRNEYKTTTILLQQRRQLILNCTYTTVQKFGVTQTISCFPWKLTFIHKMNWKLNRKYSQDIDKVRNND